MRTGELRGRRTVIVGAGVTGASVARHLAREGIDFDVADAGPDGARAALARALEAPRSTAPDAPARPDGERAALEAALGRARYHDGLDALDHEVLVLSPGIPRARPEIAGAIARGARVIGDVELFAGAVDAPVVAVTGSNGKSTVVAWLAHALRAAGVDARACGNIGLAALDALAPGADGAIGAAAGAPRAYVLELSSYQLESTESLRPLAATVLNVSEDHLDRYASIERYAETKRRVYRGAHRAVANADDARTLPDGRAPDALLGTDAPGRGPADAVGPASGTAGPDAVAPPVRWHLAANDPAHGPALRRDGEAVLPLDALRPPGRHNALNALAVLALAEPLLGALGRGDAATRAALAAGLAGWEGLPHRTELVHEAGGVRWYDDSKGTNPEACARAVEAMPGPVVLILGGLDKGADFRALAPLVAGRARLVLLIGRDRARIARALEGAAPQRECDTLEAAVAVAAGAARPGDAVLLSPGCASFDMFRNFEERGMRFRAAARAEAAA